jgi:chemosensory pili system protein ChpA (sensor histidine kinase/response regulator)
MTAKKIMLVDDNIEFLEEFKEILFFNGYEVVAISDAVSVLKAALTMQPDVILLDLKMPHKSGLQLAYELKHSTKVAHIPIIAMTGFLKEENISFMNICGIEKCIEKPFYPPEAIIQIEEILMEKMNNS